MMACISSEFSYTKITQVFYQDLTSHATMPIRFWQHLQQEPTTDPCHRRITNTLVKTWQERKETKLQHLQGLSSEEKHYVCALRIAFTATSLALLTMALGSFVAASVPLLVTITAFLVFTALICFLSLPELYIDIAIEDSLSYPDQ